MNALANPDMEVLHAAITWGQQGTDVILVTVARTWGSAPRPVGSLAAISINGQIAGSVSGGCIEDDLVMKICHTGKTITSPETVSYGVTTEEAREFGLPCGGRLVLVLEKLTGTETTRHILKQIANRRQIVRQLCLKTGTVTLLPVQPDTQPLHWDEQKIEKLFGPVWRLLIIGAGQLSQYVAQIALTLDYQVIVCDPRQEYLSSWQIPGIQLESQMPDDAVTALANDKYSAVIALTHDPKLDDMALMTALDSEAFYVGALGSRRTNNSRRKRLTTLGISETGIARLHGPIGLPIGSHTPPEIAVAIMAELTAERHGVQLTSKKHAP